MKDEGVSFTLTSIVSSFSILSLSLVDSYKHTTVSEIWRSMYRHIGAWVTVNLWIIYGSGCDHEIPVRAVTQSSGWEEANEVSVVVNTKVLSNTADTQEDLFATEIQINHNDENCIMIANKMGFFPC